MMRVLFDVTKASAQTHQSGLRRVSVCLGSALRLQPGLDVIEVTWRARAGGFVEAGTRRAVRFAESDVYLQPEVCAETDRVGYEDWLQATAARTVAVYHDAIPLKHPRDTWPKSVARHPHYMLGLTRFDLVLAVSRASRDELVAYWNWLGSSDIPPVDAIKLGADFVRGERTARAPDREPAPGASPPSLLMTGILEPRKGHALALDACEAMWDRGQRFKLDIVGRVNPHFGKPIRARIKSMAKAGRPVSHHEDCSDDDLLRLYEKAAFTVFPSRAEGLGLPVLESLWMGVPVLASNIAPVRECAEAGGCRLFESGDVTSLIRGLTELFDLENNKLTNLRAEAATRELPTWDRCGRDVATLIERNAKRRGQVRVPEPNNDREDDTSDE